MEFHFNSNSNSAVNYGPNVLALSFDGYACARILSMKKFGMLVFLVQSCCRKHTTKYLLLFVSVTWL
jgi:hypothetical protein